MYKGRKKGRKETNDGRMEREQRCKNNAKLGIQTKTITRKIQKTTTTL